MQPLLDGPRADLTESLVKDLLQSHRALQIKYGAEALDAEFAVVADIAEYISPGSTIVSDVRASVHRTCILNIDSDVASTGWSYLSGFVRPYMTLTDPQSEETARFNLGVYTLTTPDGNLGTTPATVAFTGYDLNYLLRQPIGDSYEVLAGVDPALAAADAIGFAIPGVEVLVESSGSTTPGQMTWPFDADEPYTWYDVVATLLASIGYRPVWVDWNGRFRVEPFIDVQEAPIEWTFDLEDATNIVADDRSQNIDLFNVPNWWRFVVADLTASPVEGTNMFTWEDSSPFNPGSTVNRGRTIRHIETVAAANYDDLVSYAQRRIVAQLAPAETFTVRTQPFPLAWHLDVIEFRDPALADRLPLNLGSRRVVLSTTWALPLDGQSDMEWVWQTVSDQTVASVITETIE